MTLILVALLIVGCSGGAESKDVKLPDGSNAKVSADDNGMKISGDKVSAQVGGQLTITQDDLHAPFYPGAIVDTSRSMKVKAEKEESCLAYMTSIDEPQKIADFYQEKIPGLKMTKIENGESINMLGDTTLKDGGKIAVGIIRKTKNDHCEISVAYGKTQ